MELAGFSVNILVLLFIVAVVAGLVDTLAGGGGLLAIPALMMTGISPLAVLGTNKLQGCVGTATSSLHMLANKRIHWREMWPLMTCAFFGAIVGAVAVQFINAASLKFIIPLVLFAIALYFLFSPVPHEHQGEEKISAKKYTGMVVPAIGAYDGMFGPGTGSFFAAAGVSLKGLGLIRATAQAKGLNFATNVASIIVFIFAGQVVWALGLVMMLGQVCGATLGSHLLLRISPRVLRAFVVLMCFIMLAKYLHAM